MSTVIPNSKIQNGHALTGEEVVISGISGLFPKSDNVAEFKDNLYNKVDMITEESMTFDHADLTKHLGRISGIGKFDAQFFRVTHQQADSLDAICRKLLEQAYCAMYDAGVNPLSYKGKKIGVFTSSSNYKPTLITSDVRRNPFVISGGSKTMFANRISYWLDSKGPSYSVDSPSGSFICLEHALTCLKNGTCEAAIVGGADLNVDATMTVNMRNAGLISLDGKTKCFDKNGDSHARSQSVGVVFLQKAKDAKRIYAVVRNCEVVQGLAQNEDLQQKRKPEYIINFLTNCFKTSGVSPNEVDYVEAHGAATPEADANELEAIAHVFGKENPVMVGCVKSNMGNSDSANGVCALIKVCLAYNTGKLAGNLHYNDPLNTPAIKEGKVDILTDTTPFNRGVTTINSFNYTGTDCNVILNGHYRPKDHDRYKSSIPRLVLISGRQDKSLQKIFNKLKSQPIDPELIGMLHDIYQIETAGFTCRGYTILDSNDKETISLAESTKLYQGAPPPLWLLFSGMGSQWAGMGTALMRIPIFAAAVEKCQKVLEPKGVNIIRILTAPDKTIFDNVLNSFVGIAAVQIGLTDILKKIGLVPDNIIGHSVGELGCAYFDDCFSAEEMILAAYTRGLVSVETRLIKGSMAAVALGYNNMLPLCPPTIDIACHNSSDFCTISGPKDDVETFLVELKSKGIFAKAVPTGEIAFHSRYIQKAGPEFLKQLKEIVKTPVKRSSKWITTSWPEDKRDALEAELSSAEYHTNNLLSPVYFEEASRKIPNNAVIVEVAPHGLMQAIVRKSHANCTHIPLTTRGYEDPIRFLLEAFGKLYQEGYNINIGALYPKIEYPVSTETAVISDFVQWYHEEDWYDFLCDATKRKNDIILASRTIPVSIQDDDYKFMAGHLREGNIVFPEAAILFYIWNTFAMFKGVDHNKLSVIFRDVQFFTDVIIDAEETVNLKFQISKGNQYFEVTRDSVAIAKGFIEPFTDTSESEQSEYTSHIDDESANIQLRSDDIYRILKLKGHCYEGEFKSIHTSSSSWKSSLINMRENWIILLDSLIQINILSNNYDGVSVPKFIRELTIDTTKHLQNIESRIYGDIFLNIQFFKSSGVTKCGGLKMNDIIFNDRPINEFEPDVLHDLTHNTNKFEDIINDYDVNKNGSFNIKFDNVKEYKLINVKPGDIGSLKWIEVENNARDTDKVKVCFAAPSMMDVNNAVGLKRAKTSERQKFGMDFSGIDNKDNRVMGLVKGGALASFVESDRDLLWPVPNHWTLQEAATVPLPYVHAFYCLVVRGNLKRGQTVFVSGGAGALGQAVISICLSLSCTVFTTVGDMKKKLFLVRLFPDLNADNISKAHGIESFKMVLCKSENERCDIVINCASGLQRELAMKCVHPVGQFFDVSDYDSVENKPFGMSYLHPCKNYANVNLSNLFWPENDAERKLMQRLVSEGIANGIIKPISHVEYSTDEVEKAFRLLSQRKHRGRAVIKMADITNLNVVPRLTYNAEGIYVVINGGGETDLAFKLTTHLAKTGAKKIILHQNDQKVSGFLKVQLAIWKRLGATVTILLNKLQIAHNCQLLSKKIGISNEIHGIFLIHPKNEIDDSSVYEHKNTDSSIAVVDNMNELSKNNCPNLKYFVIFARNSDEKENISFMEKVCDTRTELGLPALLIRTELLEKRRTDKNSVFRMMSAETALRSMEISLYRNYTKVLAYNRKRNTTEFLETIAKILGTKNIDAIENLRVNDIVLSEASIVELQFAIKENFKLSLPLTDIIEMTISRLKQLSEIRNEQNTRFDDGLKAFFDFIDCDEINASEIFVPMLTQISFAEGIQNLHAKAVNVMMLPGFEGHNHVFESIAWSLKIRATTLQLGPDSNTESMQQMALDLKERIKKRFILEPKFYLLGYSFGINVALEIAALLEKDGFIGVVYCLDSSPDALREQLAAYLGPKTETQLQNAVIKHLFHVISGKTMCKTLESKITKMNDWSKKVVECVENLKEFGKTSNQYKRNVIDTFYKRIHLAKSYDPKIKLESTIVLLKGILHPQMGRLPADYGLSKYSKNPVKVLNINSDIASAPNDSRVSNIVNQFLEPELLDEFKRKNLCDTYITEEF